MTTQEKILKVYQNKDLWKPPSYRLIAKKVGCAHSYVAKVVEKFKSNNK